MIITLPWEHVLQDTGETVLAYFLKVKAELGKRDSSFTKEEMYIECQTTAYQKFLELCLHRTKMNC